MKPPALVGALVVAILIGFGGGYVWQAQQSATRVSALEADLADVKSKMGMEIQNLKAEVQRMTTALAECERRIKEEQAQRKILEESVKRGRVLK